MGFGLTLATVRVVVVGALGQSIPGVMQTLQTAVVEGIAVVVEVAVIHHARQLMCMAREVGVLMVKPLAVVGEDVVAIPPVVETPETPAARQTQQLLIARI